MVTFVLPFLVLTVFSSLLLRVYRTQRRRRATLMMSRGTRHTASTTSTTSTASNEHSVTRVIVVVMVVFAVCNLPAKVFENVYKASPVCGTLIYVARRLSFVLEMANSTANFIVYCALRHQFRDGLRRALTPLHRQRHCRRQQIDGDGRPGLRLQRARSASPVDLERMQIVVHHRNVDVDDANEVSCRNLDVPGVLCDRNTA